jgi:zinc protease
MIEKLQAVSAAQVQAVAQKYFTDDQLTVGELDPQALPQSPKSPQVPNPPSTTPLR